MKTKISVKLNVRFSANTMDVLPFSHSISELRKELSANNNCKPEDIQLEYGNDVVLDGDIFLNYAIQKK